MRRTWPWSASVLPAAVIALLTTRSSPVPPLDPCAQVGLQAVVSQLCTHGQDKPQAAAAPSPSCLIRAANIRLLCALPGPTPSPAPDPTSRPGCGSDLDRIQAVYLRERSQPDRYDAALSTITGVAARADQFFTDTAKAEGRTVHLRYVTDLSCHLIVANVVTDRSLQSFGEAIHAAEDAGHTRDDRIYLLFIDNTAGCGIATLYPDSQPDPTRNANNLTRQYAAVYNSCLDGHTAAHELAHTMGAVQNDAPHSTGGWHCNDGRDVLCYDDGGPAGTQRNVCPAPPLLDCGRDDYLAFTPRGEYLSAHWNLVRSRWLDVT